ncbi:MAG: NUDIX hydrolase [Deltaproteobacteria bacterium]|nr:NUDIX hydrolase [Deltaproteobacteria bacterium]
MSDSKQRAAGSKAWLRQASQLVADHKVLRVRQDERISPRTGAPHSFVVLEIPDWVNVLALTHRGTVLLIEQWRAGSDAMTLEIPGGTVDARESAARAARRELLEETGYVADRWVSLGAIEPNPAIQTNRCHTFVAEDVRRAGVAQQDEGEDILVREVSLQEIDGLLASGKISHALVAVAFQKLDLWRSGLLEGESSLVD